jgi:hypothetical protein
MKKIFRSKIRFAWENLHPFVKEKIGEPNTDSAYELIFPNGSSIFVSMTTRGGTVQYLHITEHGYICQKFPEKAEEIKSGALNSVHAGQMVSIESTAAGREGDFFDFCMEAERMRKEGKQLTELDFKIFFFPWFRDPRYTLEADFMIPKEIVEYFERLEKELHMTFTDGQKRWYSKKKDMQKEKMFSEYPSTLDEAFQANLEGAYFSKEMNKVYTERRIQILPHDSNLEVDTWFDLGMNDMNVILFTQTKGPQIRFIDMYWNKGEGLAHYYGVMKEKADKHGYRYGTNNFPHDIEVRELGTGISRKQVLFELGMRNIRVGKKADVRDGIEGIRRIFSRFYFDEEKCSKLYDALFNYRREFDDKLGAFKDKPLHNEASHFADAVRLIGQLWREDMMVPAGMEREREQAFFG